MPPGFHPAIRMSMGQNRHSNRWAVRPIPVWAYGEQPCGVGEIAHKHPPQGKDLKMPPGYIGPLAPMQAPASLRPESKRGPSLWLRMRVALKRLELDSALADGADPRTTDALALRAEQVAD